MSSIRAGFVLNTATPTTRPVRMHVLMYACVCSHMLGCTGHLEYIYMCVLGQNDYFEYFRQSAEIPNLVLAAR